MAHGLMIGLFGVHRGAQAEPDALARRAQLAEQAGFESVWGGDHISLPMGGQAVAAYPPEQHRLEAISALGFLAGLTSRGRVRVAGVVLPPRPPPGVAEE